jgi:2-C-methyl-D-erythritol 4-phosphate cytidylyltransferase
MIFAAILAGGIGNRMGSIDKPKQYMLLGDKPIIIHTIEKFYINEKFEKIVVLCPKSWISHTVDLINKFIGKTNRILVINGGTVRNETIMNAINHIEDNFDIDKESVIVTHDAVRPFLTHRIIEENILYAQKYGACDTVIPATDTIIQSEDCEFISSIPKREFMFQGQTPQSFKILKLKELYNGLTDSEKEILTDAAKIFVIKGEKVHLVDGEINNIKITYPYDLKVANSMLNGE